MYLFLQIHSKCERHAGYSLLHFSSFCRVRVCVLNDHIFDHFQTNSLTHSTTKISMEPIYLFNYDESKKKGEWRNGNQKKKKKKKSKYHSYNVILLSPFFSHFLSLFRLSSILSLDLNNFILFCVVLRLFWFTLSNVRTVFCRMFIDGNFCANQTKIHFHSIHKLNQMVKIEILLWFFTHTMKLYIDFWQPQKRNRFPHCKQSFIHRITTEQKRE